MFENYHSNDNEAQIEALSSVCSSLHGLMFPGTSRSKSLILHSPWVFSRHLLQSWINWNEHPHNLVFMPETGLPASAIPLLSLFFLSYPPTSCFLSLWRAGVYISESGRFTSQGKPWREAELAANKQLKWKQCPHTPSPNIPTLEQVPVTSHLDYWCGSQLSPWLHSLAHRTPFCPHTPNECFEYIVIVRNFPAQNYLGFLHLQLQSELHSWVRTLCILCLSAGQTHLWIFSTWV